MPRRPAPILGRIAEAEARAAQEKAEQQQAAEAQRQAREREQKVTALLTKARKAKKPADALGFLEEAQRLDPQRPELAALIAQRQAEIAHAVAPATARPVARVPGPGVPERKTGTPLSPALLGGIGAVVLLLIVGIWYFLRDPTPPPDPKKPEVVDVDPRRTDPGRRDPPPVAPSAVAIDTMPWTNVTITPSTGGTPQKCVTPCRLQLAPGEYQLAFESPSGLSRPHSEPLSVARRPAGRSCSGPCPASTSIAPSPPSSVARSSSAVGPAPFASAHFARAGTAVTPLPVFATLPRDVSSMDAVGPYTCRTRPGRWGLGR